ncbi:MAG: transposase [Candidatus Nanoarchaeia archaeon]
MEKLVTAVKFKLNPTKEELIEFDNYFTEYSKAVNFAIKKIYQITKDIKFLGKKKEGIWIFPNDVCDYCNSKKEIRYQDKKNKKNICNDCYKNNFDVNALRKKMVPVIRGKRKEKLDSKLNIKNATNRIAPTHMHFAVREAYQIIKSLKAQRKKRIRKLNKDRQKLKKFEEMLDPSKRLEIPLRGRQKEKRYIHKSDKEKISEHFGYTEKQIINKIKILKRNIEREEKSLRKKSLITFKGNRIQLTPPKFDYDDNRVAFTLFKKKRYRIFATNVSSKKSKQFFQKKLDEIKKQKPNYAYLIRKEKRMLSNKKKEILNKKNLLYDYYLQYTISTPVTLKEQYDYVLGIDTNIGKTAVCVMISRENPKKPVLVKFIKGRIAEIKIKNRKQKAYLIGVHNRKRKIKKLRPIRFKIDNILHNISKEIVSIAKEKNACIVIEDLEKIKKSRIRQSRRERFYVSLFVARKLANFIQYKSLREGIKVIRIPPEFTSRICSHCGSNRIQRPYKNTISLMKCDNCGIELNADYNAAYNIAQKGLKELNS